MIHITLQCLWRLQDVHTVLFPQQHATPLHMAVFYSCAEIVRLLIDADCDMDIPDNVSDLFYCLGRKALRLQMTHTYKWQLVSSKLVGLKTNHWSQPVFFHFYWLTGVPIIWLINRKWIRLCFCLLLCTFARLISWCLTFAWFLTILCYSFLALSESPGFDYVAFDLGLK